MARTNVLITRASSGLGAVMARRFAAMNRNLALCARRTERLDALAEELRSAHSSITVSVRRLDVTDHDAAGVVPSQEHWPLGAIILDECGARAAQEHEREKVRDTPMIVGIDKGSRALVRAIEREPRRACVPAWPWRPMDLLIRVMPLRGVARFG